MVENETNAVLKVIPFKKQKQKRALYLELFFLGGGGKSFMVWMYIYVVDN